MAELLRALRAENEAANTLVGLLRHAVRNGTRTAADPEYPPYVRYRQAMQARMAVEAGHEAAEERRAEPTMAVPDTEVVPCDCASRYCPGWRRKRVTR